MDADHDTDDLMSEDEYARRFFETDLSDLGQKQEERRRGRHPALMVAVMVFSMVLMWMFKEDTLYFLQQEAEPQDLGDTMQWRRHFRSNPEHVPETLSHNAYVRVAGLTAFRTESESERQAYLKLAYVPLYVHLKDEKPSRPTDHFVHLTVSGRLLDLTRTGRYLSVQRFYAEQFDLPTRRAFMLVAEDTPGSYWWTLLLQAVFAVFFLVNGTLLVRALRP